MNLQDGQTVKLTGVLLRLSRIVSKGVTMGDTQDKIIINNNRVSMNLDARKSKKKSMLFT